MTRYRGHIAAKLEAACTQLARGVLPDAPSCVLIARAIQKLIDQPSAARDQLLRQEALREGGMDAGDQGGQGVAQSTAAR